LLHTIKKYKKMTTKTTTLEVKIYCGTYAKYNDSSIAGQWIDVTDLDKQEFYDLCRDLHSDEEDPEFMFQDTDTESKLLRDMISESGIDDEFWSLKEEMKELSENSLMMLEAFEVYVASGYDANISSFEDAFFCYIEGYDINFEFGSYYMNVTGGMSEMPKHLECYFDYEAFGRDLLINDFFEQDGYIFTRN